LGGFLIGVIGILLPPTMFWGEFEINTLANPTRPLAHIWPQGGVWGTEVFLHGKYGPGMYLLIGFVKLAAISVTVLSGQIKMQGLKRFSSAICPAAPEYCQSVCRKTWDAIR